MVKPKILPSTHRSAFINGVLAHLDRFGIIPFLKVYRYAQGGLEKAEIVCGKA